MLLICIEFWEEYSERECLTVQPRLLQAFHAWEGLLWWLRRICLQCKIPAFNPWVRKIPLEEGAATHSGILAKHRGAWRATVHGVTKGQTGLRS